MTAARGTRAQHRAQGGAEHVAWRRAGAHGPGVAIVVHTRRMGPAVGGVTHLMAGDSADAVAVAMERAEVTTMAVLTSNATLGGGGVAILGPIDDETPAAVAAMIDELAGDLWLVPSLGPASDVVTQIARHTAYVADTGLAPVAVGYVAAAGIGWRDATGTDDIAGTRITVTGVSALSDAVAAEARAHGAEARVATWTPHLPPADIVIATDTRDRTADASRDVECRVVVGTMGGPLDEQDVWRALRARGIVCVPGSVAMGELLRSVDAHIALHSPGDAPGQR